MLLDERDPLRLLVWQRPQQHGVNDAEDRRNSSDAQTERDHGNQSEARFLNEHSRSETRVLPECAHGSFSSENPWVRIASSVLSARG
jgi:hypothetical protein